MATIEPRKLKNNRTSYRVKWRTGGTRQGDWDGTTLSEFAEAKRYKGLVDSNGDHRPTDQQLRDCGFEYLLSEKTGVDDGDGSGRTMPTEEPPKVLLETYATRYVENLIRPNRETWITVRHLSSGCAPRLPGTVTCSRSRPGRLSRCPSDAANSNGMTVAEFPDSVAAVAIRHLSPTQAVLAGAFPSVARRRLQARPLGGQALAERPGRGRPVAPDARHRDAVALSERSTSRLSITRMASSMPDAEC